MTSFVGIPDRRIKDFPLRISLRRPARAVHAACRRPAREAEHGLRLIDLPGLLEEAGPGVQTAEAGIAQAQHVRQLLAGAAAGVFQRG